MALFDAISDALATLLGTTSEIAGWILGFTVLIALLIAMIWVLGDRATEGIGLIIPTGVAITFAVLVGWWPLWTWLGLILLAVMVIVFQVRPGGASSP